MMARVPGSLSRMGEKQVVVIRHEGSADELRTEMRARPQAKSGFFAVDAQVFEGDVVEYDDPRGGRMRRYVHLVDVHDVGSPAVNHIQAHWGAAEPVRTAPIRRLELQNLHPDVVRVASALFVDGHYAQAVFEATKMLELRVKHQSGLDLSGTPLMTKAFSGDPPPIDMAVEAGQSGQDEQDGFRFLFMGVTRGIRNPKAHSSVAQGDPQRALEYLALVSILVRRLDDALNDSPADG